MIHYAQNQSKLRNYRPYILYSTHAIAYLGVHLHKFVIFFTKKVLGNLYNITEIHLFRWETIFKNFIDLFQNMQYCQFRKKICDLVFIEKGNDP